jgi:uncharacterized protein with PhoU and TrkA domain
MAAVTYLLPRRLSVEIARKRGWLPAMSAQVISADDLLIARGMRDLAEALFTNVAFEEAEMLFSLGFVFGEKA